MAVTPYLEGRGLTFHRITPDNFIPDYSPHWREYFTRYKGTILYPKADILLRDMVNSKKPKGFISSDIEIKKILDNMGSSFTSSYLDIGFSTGCGAMLGMQLFEICVYDGGYNWWYFIPKPILRGHLLPHSHYYLR
jgi:hypothetical protein